MEAVKYTAHLENNCIDMSRSAFHTPKLKLKYNIIPLYKKMKRYQECSGGFSLESSVARTYRRASRRELFRKIYMQLLSAF
jgi:hypothetical protein